LLLGALLGPSACSTDVTTTDPPSTTSGGSTLGPYWGDRFGESAYPPKGISVVTSPAGRVAVFAKIHGNIDFGLGPLDPTTDPDLYDQVVVVFDAKGAPLWNRRLRSQIGGGGADAPVAIAFAGEDLIVAGTFSADSPVDLGEGPLLGSYDNSAFLARFGAQGQVLWSRTFDHGGTVSDLVTDPAGNAVLAGDSSGPVDFGIGMLVDPTSSEKPYLVKFNPAGNTLFMASIHVDGLLSSRRLGADSLGNVIVMGSLLGGADYGAGTFDYLPGFHLVTVKYDASLHPVHGARLGKFNESSNQSLSDFAVGAAGNMVVAATSDGPIDFGGGSPVAGGEPGNFLLELDIDGNRVWDRALGKQLAAPRVAFGADSSVLLASKLTGTVDLGLGPLTIPSFDQGLLLARFDAGGKLLTNRGPTSDSLAIQVDRITTTPSGDLVLLGDFSGQLDLGISPAVAIGGPALLVARIPGK
jgi:hypothetical protein